VYATLPLALAVYACILVLGACSLSKLGVLILADASVHWVPWVRAYFGAGADAREEEEQEQEQEGGYGSATARAECNPGDSSRQHQQQLVYLAQSYALLTSTSLYDVLNILVPLHATWFMCTAMRRPSTRKRSHSMWRENEAGR
jgi:hypothetical protein